MTTFSDNGASRAQGDAFPRAAASARRSHVAADAAVTGDLSEAARRANAGARAARAPQAAQGSPAAQPQQAQPSRRRATRADKKKLAAAAASSHAGTAVGSRAARSSRAATRRAPRKGSGLMRYASDNRLVQAVDAVLTGPYRVAVYACVAVALGAGLYAPVRDLYVARRNNYILSQQLKIRQDYNDTLEKEVNSYLSTDGIEQAARGMGLVTEGEKTITVTGTDENGDPVDTSSDTSGSQDSSSSSDSSDAKTSSDVERAEAAVFQNSPWYYKVLDSLFSYTGSEGQVVVAASGTDAK